MVAGRRDAEQGAAVGGVDDEAHRDEVALRERVLLSRVQVG